MNIRTQIAFPAFPRATVRGAGRVVLTLLPIGPNLSSASRFGAEPEYQDTLRSGAVRSMNLRPVSIGAPPGPHTETHAANRRRGVRFIYSQRTKPNRRVRND